MNKPNLPDELDLIGGVWLILGLMTGFYILGGKIFNRRYL